jgi:RNA polymerase sigma-70 factor (ECF subfamily)
VDIERLIDRHKDAVYRQMVKVCGNYADAEDALADAIFAAIKASHQLRDPDHMRAWLGRIGTRSCFRMRIRERLTGSVPMDDLESMGIQLRAAGPDPGEQAEIAAMKNCVASAIQAIPDLFREVYVRREILGEKAESVAGDLGLSVPAMKSRLHRARRIVRESLDSGLGCRDL